MYTWWLQSMKLKSHIHWFSSFYLHLIMYISIHPSIYLSICLSVCLSIYLSICIYKITEVETTQEICLLLAPSPFIIAQKICIFIIYIYISYIYIYIIYVYIYTYIYIYIYIYINDKWYASLININKYIILRLMIKKMSYFRTRSLILLVQHSS